MLSSVFLVAAGVATAAAILSQARDVNGGQEPATGEPVAVERLAVHAVPVPSADGWSVVTLHRLRDVERLLDGLEARRVGEREVRTLGNSRFRVRWK